MARSYRIAFILISGFMVLMLGRVRMGLLSMIPNILPIIVVMGIMGWVGIRLDFGTILIGSITLGLVVDDTIHFLDNFSRYYDECGDPLLATQKTLNSVGRAMLVTSVVLAGGFLCDFFSLLTINKYSGALIALTILIALITDFFCPQLFFLLCIRKNNQCLVQL